MSKSFKVDFNVYRSSTTFAYLFTQSVVCTTSGGRKFMHIRCQMEYVESSDGRTHMHVKRKSSGAQTCLDIKHMLYRHGWEY